MDQLRVSATANGLNYLPEYYADAVGLFAGHGLQVTTRACDPWTGVLDDLDSGAADLALGGLWVPAMFAGTARRLTVLTQLNHQFPMAVVTREDLGPITLDWLTGKVALAPGAGGSAPFEFTAGLMREAGVDPTGTRWVRDLSTAMLVELFRQGLGDAIVVDLVTAHGLQADGSGWIAFRHLDAGGVMPNSVYYTRTDRLEELRDRVERFDTAIAEAMRALPTAEPDVVDGILRRRWPTLDLGVLRTAVAEMTASRVWQTTTVDPDASDRWMGILADAGLVTSPPSYRDLMSSQAAGAVAGAAR